MATGLFGQLRHGVVGALRPSQAPLATSAALRAIAAAGLIVLASVAVGGLEAVGIAYLGAACSVAFIIGAGYRMRLVALSSQAAGAALGIAVGAALPATPAVQVAAATCAAAFSGLVGAVGPTAPGFGMMLSVGMAFGQFGGSTLPWWQQACWYLTGTTVVVATTLGPWLWRRGRLERAALVAVFDAAGDLCAASGDNARPARARLTAASTAARSIPGHERADLVAFAAATMYADAEPVPTAAVAAIRRAALLVAAGRPPCPPVDFTISSAGLAALADALSPQPARPGAPSLDHRWRTALRAMRSASAVGNAGRLGLSLGVATGLTAALHPTQHAFWLPLTVAVIVRPEYGSVFVRTINRVVGTVAGALLAATALLVLPPGLAIAGVTALALGFAVWTAPRLYGLSVIGVTASALLSMSIAHPDPVAPGLRLVDTLLGAGVAIVFGYLLWPNARRLTPVPLLDQALTAAHAYLAQAVREPGTRFHWQTCRDEAYRQAHLTRAAVIAATVEPPPVQAAATSLLPATVLLEDTIDLITAAAATVDAGGDPTALVVQVGRQLTRLEDAAETARPGVHSGAPPVRDPR